MGQKTKHRQHAPGTSTATMRQDWCCEDCYLGAIGTRLPPQPGEGEDEQTPGQAEQEGSTVENHGGKPPHTVSLCVMNNPLSARTVHTAAGTTNSCYANKKHMQRYSPASNLKDTICSDYMARQHPKPVLRTEHRALASINMWPHGLPIPTQNTSSIRGGCSSTHHQAGRGRGVRHTLRKLRARRSVARRAASRKASPVMAMRTVANLVR